MRELQHTGAKRPKPIGKKVFIGFVCVFTAFALYLNLSSIPALNHLVQVPRCERVYREHRNALNKARDWLLSQDFHDETTVKGTELQAARLFRNNITEIDVTIAYYGDFYQHSYEYGLIWTEEAEAIERNEPIIDLRPLEDGWYVYTWVLSQ